MQKKDIEHKCISERGRESLRCACRDRAEEQKAQEDAEQEDTDAGRAEQCSRTMMRLVSH
jgi:hypothetical protein